MGIAIQSERLRQRLLSQAETGMGYQIVTVLLADGRQFRRVAVIDGYLTAKGGDWAPPFSESEIADLVVTHDKSGPPVEVK
jgi:hypothetical protein